jgi:hypothetical protein
MTNKNVIKRFYRLSIWSSNYFGKKHLKISIALKKEQFNNQRIKNFTSVQILWLNTAIIIELL